MEDYDGQHDGDDPSDDGDDPPEWRCVSCAPWLVCDC